MNTEKNLPPEKTPQPGPNLKLWLALGLAVLLLVWGAFSINFWQKTYGPYTLVEQPIEFPHNTHTDKLGMNCMYCHTYARRSAVAGIPPLAKCMGCHQFVPSVADTPRIKKLVEYWEKKEAIPWKKVHDLPDFVRFNHERHIQRFVFKQDKPVQEACGLCHGNFKAVTVAEKKEPLTMGWCVSCHEKDHPVDRNSAMTSKGPNDCWQCHK